MASRLAAALAATLVLTSASVASAAQDVQPRAGILMSGQIDFPRKQGMSIVTDPRDGSKLSVSMGFDGRCKGGGLAEVWAANIPARPTVKVKNGRFSAKLKAKVRNYGGVAGRTGTFKWKLTGRFTAEDAATATVSGSAEVRTGRAVARCTIAAPSAVRLAVRGA